MSERDWAPPGGGKSLMREKESETEPSLLPKEEGSSENGTAIPEGGKAGEEKSIVSLIGMNPEEGIVVRTERIEIQGLSLSLTKTYDGRRAVRLTAKRARAYGLELVAGQKNTPAGAWGMVISDRGPVSIQGLVADATALGFMVKGLPVKLDRPLPSVVLHDVYLKVVRLETDRISLPQTKLETKREVSLASGGPALDLGRLSGLSGTEELTDRVNEVLARLSGVEESEELVSDEQRESGEADSQPSLPPEPEEPTGGPEQPERSPLLPPRRFPLFSR